MKPKKSKRIRKKLHIGEFQQLGFDIEIKYSDQLTNDRHHEILDEIIDLIESYNLYIGGGDSFTIYGEGYASVTEEQRGSIIAWMSNRSDLTLKSTSPLYDIWYPPEEQYSSD